MGVKLIKNYKIMFVIAVLVLICSVSFVSANELGNATNLENDGLKTFFNFIMARQKSKGRIMGHFSGKLLLKRGKDHERRGKEEVILGNRGSEAARHPVRPLRKPQTKLNDQLQFSGQFTLPNSKLQIINYK